jgi:hypothetical protein
MPLYTDEKPLFIMLHSLHKGFLREIQTIIPSLFAAGAYDYVSPMWAYDDVTPIVPDKPKRLTKKNFHLTLHGENSQMNI